MAFHHITHACGHTQDHQLYGNRRARDSRIEWEEERLCYPCWKQEQDRERQEKNGQNAAANAEAGMPPLAGSPRQVAWAETIRAQLQSELKLAQADCRKENPQFPRSPGIKPEEWEEAIDLALAALMEVTSASWLIEYETGILNLRALLVEAHRGRFAPRSQEQAERGFFPFGRHQTSIPAQNVIARDDELVQVRLTRSRWEGCVVLHPAKMTKHADDGTLTLHYDGHRTIRVFDGARERRVRAEEFHADRSKPLTEEGPRHFFSPPSYRPGARNEIDVPEEDATTRHPEKPHLLVVQLRCSQWEGLHFYHPVSMTRHHRPGYVTLLMSRGGRFNLWGGEKRLIVSEQELYEDRLHPLPAPGPSLAVEKDPWHRLVCHPTRVKRTQKSWRLRCDMASVWPDAVVYHRPSMCQELETGHLEWRFPPQWKLMVRAADGSSVEVDAADFVADASHWAHTQVAPGEYTREPEVLPVPDEIPVPAELLDDETAEDSEGGLG